MGSYLVETYLAQASAGEPEGTAARARHAAAELSREGKEVRHVRSFFLSDDETCFHFFHGDSIAAVSEAITRACIPSDRISEVLESDHI